MQSSAIRAVELIAIFTAALGVRPLRSLAVATVGPANLPAMSGDCMPEPILISIAAALAGKGTSALYDVVKKKFAGSPEATATLADAQDSAPDSPQIHAAPDSPQIHALAHELERAESSDPEFAADLRAVWGQVSVRQHAGNGGVANQISGTVNGKVLQARDIEGGASF